MSQTVIDFHNPQGHERRRHPRTQVRMGLRCVFLEPDGPRIMDHMDMVDLSRSGVGALSNYRYYPGQRVMVCLPAAADGSQRSMYATVTRCQKERDSGYQVGLRFDAATVGTNVDIGQVVRAAA